jgi:chorismate mutase
MTHNELLELREEIDKIDANLFRLFEKRFEISKKIGEEKKKNKMYIYDLEREKNIIMDKIKRYKLREGFIKNIYKIIFEESRRIQKND